MLKIFLVTTVDGQTRRIRASHWSYSRLDSAYYHVEFFRAPDAKQSDCMLTVERGYSVIPEDMLYESIESSFVMPTSIDRDDPEHVQIMSDVFFSDAERVPYSTEERRSIRDALQAAKTRIREEFETTPEQQAAVDDKLDYLASKVTELDRFNWKRLLVTSLVAISVDLSFGTFVPITLLKIFLELLAQRLLDKGSALASDPETPKKSEPESDT